MFGSVQAMRPGLEWRMVARWWNGSFGRLNQRRIWLFTDGRVWRVQARQGDGDARVWERDVASENEARALIDAMLARTPRDDWRRLPT